MKGPPFLVPLKAGALLTLLLFLPCNIQGSSELIFFLGGGQSSPWGSRGELKPSGKMMLRSGLNYEMGRFSIFMIHMGGSLSRFQLEWEDQESLNMWTYYQAGVHIGVSRILFPSPRWGNRLGVTVNSKWIPAFFLHDNSQEYTISEINKNGMTDIDLYIRQNLGPISLRGFFIFPISQLIPQGNLKVGAIGMDILIHVFKK